MAHGNQLRPAGDHAAGHGDPLEFEHRLAEQRIGLLARGAIGDEIKASAIKEPDIDRLRRNKCVDFDHMLAFTEQRIQFFWIDDHVFVLGVFEAAHDLVFRDFAMLGANLFVLNAAMAAFVKLMKMNLAAARDLGRNRLHGHGHQTEPQAAFPTGAKHGVCLIGERKKARIRVC